MSIRQDAALGKCGASMAVPVTTSPPSAAGPDVTSTGMAPNKLVWQRASLCWNFDDATCARSTASFDNPDHLEIVIHNYRRQLGLAVRDSSYEVRRTDSPPVRWSQSRQITLGVTAMSRSAPSPERLYQHVLRKKRAPDYHRRDWVQPAAGSAPDLHKRHGSRG